MQSVRERWSPCRRTNKTRRQDPNLGAGVDANATGQLKLVNREGHRPDWRCGDAQRDWRTGLATKIAQLEPTTRFVRTRTDTVALAIVKKAAVPCAGIVLTQNTSGGK